MSRRSRKNRGTTDKTTKTRRNLPQQEKFSLRWPIIRFGLGFGALMTVFYVISSLPWWNEALYLYLKANANVSHVFLNMAGQQTQVDDLVIRSGDFAIAVKRGCDAIEPTWFFIAAVVAFPLPWRRKAWGIVLGVSFLLTLNLVRIVSLYLLGKYQPSFFQTAHLEIWPAVFVVAAVILWAIWLRWAKRDEVSPR
ncbi:MAG: exosortase H [Verrucomicrobiae bacterium]